MSARNAHRIRTLIVATAALLFAPLWLHLVGGCDNTGTSTSDINPFQDLPAIDFDGRPHELTSTIAPLGYLESGRVIRVRISGRNIESVLILSEDAQLADAGDLAGGGRPNEFFDYRVQISGRYFAYVQFEPSSAEADRLATITAASGDSQYQPPSKQTVLVVFEDNYLTDPGLVDPESFTDEERQVLSDISDTVYEGIIARLQSIFEDTPVEILTESDPAPTPPFSTLTFSPRRVVADSQLDFDSALPPVGADSPCLVPVIFGEVLPRGSKVDPGNRVPDDEAMVYVGSFQGRGLECRSAAANSLNTIVLALAHTGAHEIGHLVGLYHVALVDIMDRRPTLAFQRQLGFGRGQILVETPTESGTVETRVLTNIYQDPALYFQANFSQ